jgi:hypothetical protein
MKTLKRNKGKKLNQTLSVLKSGGGVSSTPSVICMQSAFPAEFVGNWWCFHGDGTSHGYTGGGVYTASGLFTNNGGVTSVSQQVSGNGPNSGLLTGISLDGTNKGFSGPTTDVVDYTVGALIKSEMKSASAEAWVAKWGPAAGGKTYLMFTNTALRYFSQWYKTDATVTQKSNAASDLSVRGAVQSVIGTYRYVADGTSLADHYLDGVLRDNSTVAVGPPQVNAAPWTVGYSPNSSNYGNGILFCAFMTEKYLSAATAAAMSAYQTGKLSGSFGEALTYTRASQATCITPDGTVTKLPTNRPAIINGGILIEPAGTNLCLQSEDLGTTWQINKTTLSLNAATAPDGNKTADQITLQADNAAAVFQNITGLASTTYTFSFWGWSDTPGTQFRISRNNNVSWVTATVSPTYTTTTTPTRYSLTFTTLVGETVNIIDIGGEGLTPFTPTAGSMYVWGAQMETGTFATSYIPTTTASATRALPAFTWPFPAGNTFATQGSAAMGIATTYTGGINHQFLTVNGGSNNVLMYDNGGQTQRAYNGTTVATINTTRTAGVFRWYSTDWSTARNQLTVTERGGSTHTVAFSGFTLGSTLNIGGPGSDAVLKDLVLSKVYGGSNP